MKNLLKTQTLIHKLLENNHINIEKNIDNKKTYEQLNALFLKDAVELIERKKSILDIKTLIKLKGINIDLIKEYSHRLEQFFKNNTKTLPIDGGFSIQDSKQEFFNGNLSDYSFKELALAFAIGEFVTNNKDKHNDIKQLLTTIIKANIETYMINAIEFFNDNIGYERNITLYLVTWNHNKKTTNFFNYHN